MEKIELNETHRKGRLIAAALFLAIGAVALAYGLLLLVAGEGGWREVEAVGDDPSCAADFTLYYHVSGAAENRALSAFYGQAAQTASRLFSAEEASEGSGNLASLNRQPNQILTLDPAVYEALSLLQESGRRELYLAPAARRWAYLFLAEDDVYAAQLDPWEDAEQAAAYAELAAFARDPQSVNLELLGENRARLSLSETYLHYAQENEIDVFVDFGWMKNAFIADYLADALSAQGYTGGVLSSVDGFSRSLSPAGTSYSLSIYHREGDTVRQAAVLDYEGPTAAVCLRDYPLVGGDALRFYRYADGQRRTTYLSPADGRCHAAVDTLTAYSGRLPCARLLLALIPVYVQDQFDPASLLSLRSEGLEALWCREDTLWYTDPALRQGGLRQASEAAYEVKLYS